MPASNEARRWLITGCSSGLGKCLAEAALARGDRVILTARSVAALGDLPARYPSTARSLEGISEALNGELAPFGVRVLIVEPAGFRTQISQAVRYAAGTTDTYRESSGVWQQRMQAFGGKEPGDPVLAALAIIRAVDDPAAPLRLPLGAITPGLMVSHLQGVMGNIAGLSAVAADCDFPR